MSSSRPSSSSSTRHRQQPPPSEQHQQQQERKEVDLDSISDLALSSEEEGEDEYEDEEKINLRSTKKHRKQKYSNPHDHTNDGKDVTISYNLLEKAATLEESTVESFDGHDRIMFLLLHLLSLSVVVVVDVLYCC